MSFLRQEYEHFLIVCQYENISKASEKCGILQGGLSKIIQKLEHEHATPLFFRRGKGVILTEYGRKLQIQLLSLKKHETQFRVGLGQDRAEVQGILKMGAHPSIAASYAHRFYPELMQKYPKLTLEVDLDSSRHVTQKVVAGQLDFGLVVSPLPFPDLVIKKLASESVCAWVNKKNGPSLTVYYNPDMLGINKILKNYKKHKQIAIGDYEVLASFAMSGDGIYLLPDSVAGRMKGLRELWKKERVYTICLIYRVDHAKNLNFTTCLEFIQKKFVP